MKTILTITTALSSTRPFCSMKHERAHVAGQVDAGSMHVELVCKGRGFEMSIFLMGRVNQWTQAPIRASLYSL